AAMLRPARNSRATPSCGTVSGPAAGWAPPASSAAGRAERMGMIRCPRLCPARRSGICRGGMGGGDRRVRLIRQAASGANKGLESRRNRANQPALPANGGQATNSWRPKMIKVTFPDGAAREYAKGTTGTTIVEGISKSLAKKTVAMRWNGVLSDLSDPLEADGAIEFVLRDDEAALELIRHDAAHVLAEA